MSSIKNPDNLYSQNYKEKNKVEAGTLYLVATPIGNLSDLSERAIKVLKEVDFIAAEDTRNTIKLLNLIGTSKPMVSYFEHNKRQRGEVIAERLKKGESCALVTDAGTPAISDPGEDLVKLCVEEKIPVTSIPGSCAMITALTLSGLPTGRFTFEGFLSVNKRERFNHLKDVQNDKRTLIFYEAPHKLKDTLKDMLDNFGNRKISLCRELTKLNEEVIRTDLEGAVAYYNKISPKGEYVLVIEGAKETGIKHFWDDMSINDHVEYYINSGLKKMDAIKAVASDREVAKSEIYRIVINNKND